MGTRLEFDSQHHIEVDESFSEVESKLLTASPGVAGIVRLKVNGQVVLVNAALVRVTKAPPQYDTADFDQA